MLHWKYECLKANRDKISCYYSSSSFEFPANFWTQPKTEFIFTVLRELLCPFGRTKHPSRVVTCAVSRRIQTHTLFTEFASRNDVAEHQHPRFHGFVPLSFARRKIKFSFGNELLIFIFYLVFVWQYTFRLSKTCYLKLENFYSSRNVIFMSGVLIKK